jgi:P27 family predicted phage terminase small subunit
MRNRRPIDLLLVEGKKNWTKAEIEQRRREELTVYGLDDVQAPDYLPESMKAEFDEIAAKLQSLNIMTELDEDTLARYLIAKRQHLVLTKKLDQMLVSGEDIDETNKVSIMLDKAFKQCRQSANDLGLTISSRCRLVVPKVEEAPENKFLKFAK